MSYCILSAFEYMSKEIIKGNIVK